MFSVGDKVVWNRYASDSTLYTRDNFKGSLESISGAVQYFGTGKLMTIKSIRNFFPDHHTKFNHAYLLEEVYGDTLFFEEELDSAGWRYKLGGN